ncbi:hypothetical protein ACFXKS_07475 [Streptomyces scopuliridis]|uniref:hypothetical protein n=1 Tax=Streptomyces scopuliridis TaxID=452529 RepID=UPI003674144C
MLWESADGRQTRGLREITLGVVTDTEADELSFVAGGRTTVAVEGGPPLKKGG